MKIGSDNSTNRSDILKTAAAGAVTGAAAGKVYRSAKPIYNDSIKMQQGWLDKFAKISKNHDVTADEYVGKQLKRVKLYEKFDNIVKTGKEFFDLSEKNPQEYAKRMKVRNPEWNRVSQIGLPAYEKELEVQRKVLNSGKVSKSFALGETTGKLKENAFAKARDVKNKVTSFVSEKGKAQKIKNVVTNGFNKVGTKARGAKEAAKNFIGQEHKIQYIKSNKEAILNKAKGAGKVAAPVLAFTGLALAAKAILNKVNSNKEEN